MDGLPRAAKTAIQKAKRYDFRTFAVGISLPEGVQEREDELRSDLRLKGNETIKAQAAAIVSAEVAAALRKRIDRLAPELTLLVSPGTGEVAASSRSVFLSARYTKPRGVLQKRKLCPECRGKGCPRCRGVGFERGPSVEELVRRRLLRYSGSDKTIFTWLGSEDKESRVFSPGRPFVVEVKNPVKRTFPRRFVINGARGQVSVSGLRILPAKPTRLPPFRFRAEIEATAASRVPAETLPRLRSAFREREVRFERPRGKPTFKKVYRASATARGRKLTIMAELDGGLPVKRFVNGELVSPSVSEVLKTEVRCRRFDIRRVTKTGSFGNGEVAWIQKKN